MSDKSSGRTAPTVSMRDAVRQAGLRCTAARMAVMEALARADSPVTHAQLAADLVPKGFDKATVYRNLVDLSDAGLVLRSELGDHVWRFEMRGLGDREAHPHFVCVDCGSVTCLTDVEFNAATKKRASKVGRVTEVLLKGYCNNCE